MLVGRRRSPLAASDAGASREADAPDTLLRVGATLLWENLPALVALNLAGVVAAVPIILLGSLLGFLPFVALSAVALFPVAGGLLAAATGELRGEPGSPRGRFLATIRTRWRPLILLGLFANYCAAGCLVTTARVLNGATEAGTIAFWLVQSAFLVLLVVLLTYALPLAAAYGAGVRLALRNALVMAITAPGTTLGMVGLLVAFAVATLWLGLGMWLIAPVVAAVFLAANCHRQVERRRQAAGRR